MRGRPLYPSPEELVRVRRFFSRLLWVLLFFLSVRGVWAARLCRGWRAVVTASVQRRAARQRSRCGCGSSVAWLRGAREWLVAAEARDLAG